MIRRVSFVKKDIPILEYSHKMQPKQSVIGKATV